MFRLNSYFKLALYILLLVLFSGTLFLLIYASSWYAIIAALGVFFVAYFIIKLFNRIPRKFSFFLNAVENQDSTLFFPENIRHKHTKEMNKSLNRVNRLIQEVKLRNREQEQYYSSLLEQVSTGILVVNNRGSILLVNRAAKELLKYPYLSHIEQLRRVDANLYQAFNRLQEEGRREFVKIAHSSGSTQLSIHSTKFVNLANTLRVYSIQDISNELDAKEVESWQKLIRVLTHEIMNSITPITSLSETILKYYVTSHKPDKTTLGINSNKEEDKIFNGVEMDSAESFKLNTVDEKTIANTIKGLKVIYERGTGLIHFIESYRKLTRLSKPIFKSVVLKDMIEHLLVLMEYEPYFHRISFSVEVNPVNICIEVDEAQLSQVFINLIKNAMQAVEHTSSPKIDITAKHTDTGYLEVSVVDNGPGIPLEIMDHIFIPFFTTKDNGSGIGLSLSRQIMRNHGGSIEVVSSSGNTQFTLKFIQ